MRAGWNFRVLIVLVAVFVAAACSGDSDEATSGEAPIASPQHAAELRLARDEYGTAMAACLNERGISTTYDGAGGLDLDSSALSQEDIDSSLDECEADLVTQGAIAPPAAPTDEYYNGLYDYYLTLTDCLEAEGFVIEEPPSREVFVESDGVSWYPYQDIGAETIGLGRWNELQEQCPQSYLAY